MKKAFFVLLAFAAVFPAFAAEFGFLSMNFNFAVNQWEADANTSAVSSGSGGSKTIGAGLSAGKYIFDDSLAAGIDFSVNFYENGNIQRNTISTGPFGQYYFRLWEPLVLSVKGRIIYTRHNGSFEWRSDSDPVDANSIRVILSPYIHFAFNDAVWLDLRIMDLGYAFNWFTFGQWDYQHHQFFFQGPYSSPSFGVTFRF